MATLDEILKQQQLLEMMITNFVIGLEESDGTTADQEAAFQLATEQWETYSITLEGKINAYGHVIQKLESEAEYYRQRAASANSKKQSKLSKAAYLRSRLEKFLMDMPGEKFATLDFKIRMQNNPVSLQIDNDYQGDIPDEFIKAQKLDEYLDKPAVKAALQNNVKLGFASLKQTRSLRGV
jgi:Siphovirus Gp157